MYRFDVTDRLADLKYKWTTTREEEINEDYESIEIGQKINQNSFIDVHGNSLEITNTNRTSIIMFSFIGCAGCEVALKNMEKRHFSFKNDIDFYYSSPVDRSSVLQKYLSKKNYMFNAFGKESKMNNYFKIYDYPTYVILDGEGMVEEIELDYDEIIRKYML